MEALLAREVAGAAAGGPRASRPQPPQLPAGRKPSPANHAPDGARIDWRLVHDRLLLLGMLGANHSHSELQPGL